MKRFLCAVMVGVLMSVAATAFASSAKPKILFIPHDDRPVSFAQTADTVKQLNYEVITPPEALLGSRTSAGKPDALWAWLFERASQADAVVLSSDSLLYGSLVASRKHGESKAVILRRAENFKRLKEINPRAGIYVFGSIMRTPRSGSAGSEEPGYYAQYGADIFNLTALEDKAETQGLSGRETRKLSKLKQAVPAAALADWLSRRDKNFAANLRLVDLARADTFRYLILGRDDNAPFSQTHKESRMLDKVSGDLGRSRFQTLAGIDEMGMVLLTRAVNDLRWNIPFVAVRYADGVGAKTIPTYSDEEIGRSIRAHLFAAGAMPVPTTKRADVVLMVNTDADGVTAEANCAGNTTAPRVNTHSFADEVERYLREGYAVAVADISFGNGADNALLAELNRRGILPRLAAYSGWNTATNSAGFAIGQGILSGGMEPDDKNRLLAVRLLDDWAYQANVRQALAGDLAGIRGGSYSALNMAKREIVKRANRRMNDFAAAHMQQFEFQRVKVDFPWNRMFEVSVELES